MRAAWLFAALLCSLVLALPRALAWNEPAAAQEKTGPGGTKSVEELAQAAKKSIVVILYTGRDGRQQGLGAGFVVSNDGLIATNYHVIGEARPITVQFPDGSKYEVVTVHAADRIHDLAIVRVKARKLTALPLGDSATLKDGGPIVALGHPLGLEHSVVAGVLSGKRDIDGVSLLQIAIPIEKGNSGGPVLDMHGRVVGVVSMKSLVAPNLGFAVPVNALKSLLAKPSPIPMERWLTIGALDKSEWQTVYGGRWRQRAGRIIAEGLGAGFGGRSLCLWQREVPHSAFELSVNVKLDDEKGAAGIIFGGDDRDRHYGFYPSGGKLRLTRFNGPDVFSWKILKDFASEHYRPGEWNTLKVRVEKDKIIAFVNDRQVLEHADPDYAGGRIGLAKFRDTVAQFKKFQVAERIAPTGLGQELRTEVEKILARMERDESTLAKERDALVKLPAATGNLLRDKARRLEKQAADLNKLAGEVHHQRCLADLEKMFRNDDKNIDLARVALTIARLDNEELDEDVYRQEIDRLARAAKATFSKDASAAGKIEALNRFLFKERGFHGSRLDYYTRNNSYLNEVIDDREGLPITLSVLYMEIARRLELKVVGVALPGHFVVRFEPDQGEGQLIDVYEGGQLLTKKEAAERVEKITGEPTQNKDFAAVSTKAIALRMLHNLIKVAQEEKDRDGMLRYLDGIVAIEPSAHEERWVRAVFRFQSGLAAGCVSDCDYLLEQAPMGVDLARVRKLRQLVTGE